jgi:imidazolonepropionase-like amidohydrolase
MFMRSILSALFIITTLFCSAQQVYFPVKELSDSNRYARIISDMASAAIPAYQNTDRAGYFNDLFRLQFAKQDHQGVLQSLDSFDLKSGMDKLYYKMAGFHYRMHSLASLAILKNPSTSYDRTFAGIFSEAYTALPEAGKEQVKGIYDKANTEEEKQSFIALIKKFQATGKDSISIGNAIDLIKQWNYWQVYSKTVALAKAEIARMETASNIKKQAETLHAEEGGTVQSNSKTFIRNVTLVDVEKQKLVPNANVGITGNTITSVSVNTKYPVPADATIIDGTGKFLLPGMTDAHVHFFQSGGLYTRPDVIDLRNEMPYQKEIDWGLQHMSDPLKRYIQNGITSVIDVGSSIAYLELRKQYQQKSYAPAIYMTGPLITSYEPEAYKKLGDDEPFSLVANEDEARKTVQQQLPHHPDFIKIWYILEQGPDKEKAAEKFFPAAKAAIDEAHKNNLKVAVHATERITAEMSVKAGCDFLVHSVDDEIISDGFLKLLKSKNVILCPTLVVFQGYRNTLGQELDFTKRELAMANPEQLGSLYELKHLPEKKLTEAYQASMKSNKSTFRKQDSICLVNLKKLVDAGIRIAAGTDAGNIGTMHATSYINELKEMKKSGISNWQVIQSATLNPQFIVGKEKLAGSIAIGKTADLILLNADPTIDLDNLTRIDLVINKGFIIRPDTLLRETPLSLVQKQLNAYNARNLEAFLEPYDEDVDLYEFPSKLISKGKMEMRKGYEFLNTVPELHCEIKERIIQGNIIIDKESVTGFGNKAIEATAIYEIENYKIRRVYFISKN